MSSIKDFTVALSDLRFVGKDLSRPENLIAEKDGTLWISDSRGLVTHLDPEGTQTLLGSPGGERNGPAIDREGNIYVPGMSDGILYKLYRDGTQEVALSQIDGDPLGGGNFVMIDRQERLWVSISTRELPYFPALVSPRSDGYIILIDDKGPRIVADGIMFTNEIRLDANEEYLYVVETLASRILRFPVHEDGSLGEREVFGPADLGYGGIPDGIAFDVEGNLWVAMIARNGLGIITQDGDYHVVFEDVNESGLDEVLTKLEAGTLAMEDVGALCGATLQLPTGIAFGGSDLKTVYMGSLAMPHLVTFESPVAGLPMRHWQ